MSYRPDRMDPFVLKSLHHHLLMRLTNPDAIKAVQNYSGECKPEPSLIRSISLGSALLCSGEIVMLQPGIRRIPHIRHLYKYLDIPLPPAQALLVSRRSGWGGCRVRESVRILAADPHATAQQLGIPRPPPRFCTMGDRRAGRRGLGSPPSQDREPANERRGTSVGPSAIGCGAL